MTLPRALQTPRVWYTDQFDSVVLRVPTSPWNANEFIEVTLDRHTAHKLALDIMVDAERAKDWVAAEKRRAK